MATRPFLLAAVLTLGANAAPASAQLAYVSNERGSSVSVIDTASLKVVDCIKTGGSPWHLAITADGARAVVANGTSDDIAVVDLASRNVAANIATGKGPGALFFLNKDNA